MPQARIRAANLLSDAKGRTTCIEETDSCPRTGKMPFFIFGIQKVLYSRIRENYDGSGSLKCEGIEKDPYNGRVEW